MTLPVTGDRSERSKRSPMALSWFFAGCRGGGAARPRSPAACWRRRHGVVRIGYPDGRFVEVTPGTSVLEASRIAGIPHASVCGGRGRCSTCRVRVRGEVHSIDPPSANEMRVLRRIGARPQCPARLHAAAARRGRGDPAIAARSRSPPTVRQPGRFRRRAASARSPSCSPISAALPRSPRAGCPMMSCSSSTAISPRWDAPIESAGGRVDKFIGDGVMALFGIESGAQAGCREALAAARLMSERLAELNSSLRGRARSAACASASASIAGPVIVGEMGYGKAAAITAIGDAVNTASRLEALTKDYDCELVVSDGDDRSRRSRSLRISAPRDRDPRQARDAGDQNLRPRRRPASTRCRPDPSQRAGCRGPHSAPADPR